jgi:glycerol-3-phosphate O-acyltransferase/dihydroxyacetone phosphate acyltransferase
MPDLRQRTKESSGTEAASYASVVANGDTHIHTSNSSSSATPSSDSDSSNGQTGVHKPSGSNSPPLMYKAIRFFFKVCLHSFYAHVEVEGTENIAPDNYPAMLGNTNEDGLSSLLGVTPHCVMTGRQA